MIIADTGFWLALLFRRDDYHAAAAAAYARFKGELISTWPILTETCYLLSRRVDVAAAPALLERVGRAFQVWELPVDAAQRAAVLMTRYAALPMDLADASAVLLAEHLGHGLILTTDRRDFDTYRWKTREPFENLMLQD
jgi:uncharacterized protein